MTLGTGARVVQRVEVALGSAGELVQIPLLQMEASVVLETTWRLNYAISSLAKKVNKINLLGLECDLVKYELFKKIIKLDDKFLFKLKSGGM